MSATRYILEISDDGDFMTIGDGFSGEARKYEIAGDDAPTVLTWLPSSQVQIRPSRSKQFSARIYNIGVDASVKAVPVGTVPYRLPSHE